MLKQRSPRGIRMALQSIPSGILTLYSDEKERIMPDDPEVSDLPKWVFTILCAVSRLMTLLELQKMLAMLRGEDAEDLDALDDREYILSRCGFFVIIRNELVRFSHASMEEFWSRTPEVQEQSAAWVDFKFDNVFEGLVFQFRNENHPQEGVDSAFNDAASDAFSQFSTDTTAVNSFDGVSSSSRKPTITSDFSLPAQIVKIFTADNMFCDLAKVAIGVLGAVGFEKLLSALLKDLSKALWSYAKKDSQRMAAMFLGQRTRRTASLLRSVVQPDDLRDFRQKASVEKPNSDADRKVSTWLRQQDVPKRPAAQATTPTPSAQLRPIGSSILRTDSKEREFSKSLKQSHVFEETTKQKPTKPSSSDQLQSTKPSALQPDLEDIYDDGDKDIQDAWMDLTRLQVFILGSPPFMDLRLALYKHVNPLPEVWISNTPKIAPAPKSTSIDRIARLVYLISMFWPIIIPIMLFNVLEPLGFSTGLRAVDFATLIIVFVWFKPLKYILHSIPQSLSSENLTIVVMNWIVQYLPKRENLSDQIPEYHKPGNTLFKWTCVRLHIRIRIISTDSFLLGLWGVLHRLSARVKARRCPSVCGGFIAVYESWNESRRFAEGRRLFQDTSITDKCAT